MNVKTETVSPSPFRQATLDRVSSPEQFDRLLTVTTARSWIAVSAVAALIAVAIGWSLLGRLPSYVQGEGVFLSEGSSIASTAAPGSGTLARLSVGKGDHVEAGEVVGQIVRPDSQQQIAGLQALVAEREDEVQRQRSFADQEINANRAAVKERETGLLEVQANGKRRVKALTGKLSDEKELFAAHIVTRSVVLQAQADVDRAFQELAATDGEISQLDIHSREVAFQGEQRVKNAEFALSDARRQLTELTESYRGSSELRAPEAGTVDEIQLRVGSLVTPGQSVLTIETSGHGLEFVLFVPLQDGEKIQRGQSVRISPHATVREEEGTMLGTVREISKLPITPEGLRTLLHNEDLVRHFSGAGPVFVVHIQLRSDTRTKSGYAWTSSKGANVLIAAGGFGGGDVLVKSQRPITLAIPALRRWTGI